MDCDQVRDILFDAGDSDLPEELRTQVQAHLSQCGSCADEAAALQREWDALKALPEEKAPAGFLHRVHERIERPGGTQRAGKWLSSVFGGKGLVEAVGLAVSAVLVVVIYQAVTREVPRPKRTAVPPTVEAPARVQSFQSESWKGRAGPDALQPSPAAPAPAGSDLALQKAEPAILTLTLIIPAKAGRRHEAAGAAAPAPHDEGMNAPRSAPSPMRERGVQKGVRQDLVGRERDREMQAARDEVMLKRGAASAPAEEKERHVRQDSRLRDGHGGEVSVKDDPATVGGAVERIRKLVEEAHGHVATIEPSENTDPQEATVVAEIPREAFPGFFSGLKQLGSIQEAEEEAIQRQGGPTVRFSLQVTRPRG
ncbi:MAG: DUF4349 domain-containing protein [Syntrophobacteraceae bacterium]|nr:DUF4349 domain-containing protein [Syntrophobacteraceae bacterium]